MKYDKMVHSRKMHYNEIRKRLEDTLIKLQEAGYTNISVNQLAESAGVARSTVYHHKEIYQRLCDYNQKKKTDDSKLVDWNKIQEGKVVTTYEEYLDMIGSLSFERMQEIHQEMLSEIQGDPEAEELYELLMLESTRYATKRMEWAFLNRKQKMERDEARSSSHDSVIKRINMITRYLKSQSKEAKWRSALGDEKEDAYARKTIGDFACYLVFVNSLNMR